MKSRVYVVQQHFRYDPDRDELVPRYDLTPATKWGKLCILLHGKAGIEQPQQVVAKMNLLLGTFCDDDYLLLIGNPALIGWATAIAAAHNEGRVKQLIWSGELRDYKVVSSCLPVRHLVV